MKFSEPRSTISSPDREPTRRRARALRWALLAAALTASWAAAASGEESAFRAWTPGEEFRAANFSPSSPRFSPDGEYLYVGNRAAEALLLVRLPDELFQVPLDLVPAFVELLPSGDSLLLAERERQYGVRLGRLTVGSWESAWKVLDKAGPLADLALSPRGDRVYLAEINSSGLWHADLQELMKMDGTGTAVEGVGRVFLPSGPAQEIEVLGDGDRLLAVSQEAGPGSLNAPVQKGRLAAEMTLINPYKGYVVDWYWSQSGRGTASVAVPDVRFGDGRFGCLLALEDVTFEIVAYRFDHKKGQLTRKPDKLWALQRSEASQLTSSPRLVAAEQGGSVAIFAPGSRWVVLLETRLGDAGAVLTGHQTIHVPYSVSDVALSRDGCLAAVVGPGKSGDGYIRLFRCSPAEP